MGDPVTRPDAWPRLVGAPTPVHRFETLDDFRAVVGTELPASPWAEIGQAQIQGFADVTGDHEWIHVDPHRAATGPFGGTIAHGYLTLSLIPWLGSFVCAYAMPGRMVNYGFERVRFPTPVPVGARVRSHITPLAVTEHASGHRLDVRHVVEIDGLERPGCVADAVFFLMSWTDPAAG